MTHYWTDNVHTTALTPRDYQVELVAAACEKNVIVCLGHNSSKEFIAQKLIHEKAFELRRDAQRKNSLYLCDDGDSTYNLVFHLTDLNVVNLNAMNISEIPWETVLDDHQVIILSPKLCVDALICSYFDLKRINLIIIEDCHMKHQKSRIDEILNFYHAVEDKPIILGLAGPLHSAGCEPGHLGAELDYLEKTLHCKAETASDIVTVLRYCTTPGEVILQCAPPTNCEVSMFLRELVVNQMNFLHEHRYDPSEIYSDEFLEEIKSYPDPKEEPLNALTQYLEVLDELGPWCADRAALNLLMAIEKFKVKTPYERHFLLLCMTSTTFVQIRAHCEYIFQKLPTERERIEHYSTPKVRRLLDVLKLFKNPKENNKEVNKYHLSEASTAAVAALDSMNFKKLESKLEILQKSLTTPRDSEQDVNAIIDSMSGLLNNKVPMRQRMSPSKQRPRFLRQANRPPQQRQRSYWHHQNDPDALCGLIFCNSKLIAKILYNLLYEMSKHCKELDYLGVQFTVDRVADPLTETKEAEAEHRKQEEVLKRFRMHECNLLIGTSVLEEGIDLPKCNLVIRWDPPTTYRSYVQCKGRARATNAYHVIMVAPSACHSERSVESFSLKSHLMACPPDSGFQEKLETYFDEDDDDEDDDEIDAEIAKIDHLFSSDIASEIVELPTGVDLQECQTSFNDSVVDNNKPCRFRVSEVLQMFEEFECKASVERHGHIDLDEIKEDPVPAASMEDCTEMIVNRLAEYMEIEKMLLKKCENSEPIELEQQTADKFTNCIESYKPPNSNGASVNLASAIALVNKYCAKLPSDTFTKLTPLWRCAKMQRNGVNMFQYTIRLPINSPLKQDILGLPMPTRILARRVAALITCRILHQSGELDDTLQPIGKEGFRATEPDWENFELEKNDEEIVFDNVEPRPGTTKRRQYYYKRIASVFSDCRPTVGSESYLYEIKQTLECPIPEEQNTRGRKIYPPEEASQSFGILTLKKIPKISSFPIFTRSGEVKVALELTRTAVSFTEKQLKNINTFLNYTFTKVLRLQKYLMLFDAEAVENSFFIVPTVRSVTGFVDVDWNFLEVISNSHNRMPTAVSDELRRCTPFDPNVFKDAVVMPWYRNQDQPQYFYVAEICDHLSPESSFPGDNYKTFREYYHRKYEINIQNREQPLLDVDHTSARLNFLTPRYVNRKGVALPTSSEETKKAKRENLEQKQILVPELCTIHPFPASLWRAAVCLPCILYRVNALLLADEIRRQVSYDMALGTQEIEEDSSFTWPMLNFGWSLAEVLKKSREAKTVATVVPAGGKLTNGLDEKEGELHADTEDSKTKYECEEKTANELLDEADKKLKNECEMEIGTWSNEMANNIRQPYDDSDDEYGPLPPNINMCTSSKANVRYGSPTSWGGSGIPSNTSKPTHSNGYFSESDDSYSDDDYDSRSVSSGEANCLKIEFKGDNSAEAIESEEDIRRRQRQLEIINNINANEKFYQSTKNIGSGYNSFDNNGQDKEFERSIDEHQKQFDHSITSFRETIKSSGMLVLWNEPIAIVRKSVTKQVTGDCGDLNILAQLVPFVEKDELRQYVAQQYTLSLDDLYALHRQYFKDIPSETYTIEGTGDLFDQFNDSDCVKISDGGSKELTIVAEEFFHNKVLKRIRNNVGSSVSHIAINKQPPGAFSFDEQPDLSVHPGPSPSIILQALTMSNANDGINLERLETIGDSFLKYAITTYLYCTYEDVHEGKLSHLRSKQVSNLNLYRLGRRKMFGESMIATKFEPHDNWLPPCYYVPKELEKALIEARIPAYHWNLADLPNIKELSSEEICKLVKSKTEALGLIIGDDDDVDDGTNLKCASSDLQNPDNFTCFIPYNLVTQHSIPDKSVADCVEALIGAYLIECGQRGALLFMAWLGIRVLPYSERLIGSHDLFSERTTGSTRPYQRKTSDSEGNDTFVTTYGHWAAPKSPLLLYSPNAHEMLDRLLDGYDEFERTIGYQFRDRSYLLQSMTHASYSSNRLTDCYQRLEFLGDAVLDYLITRHLYEDPRQHSPGALTDLRSALVNNTIFASLAVRHGFHKYFRHLSPGLNEVIGRFVRIQHENGHSISEEFYLISEEECDEAEDVEVPKALGDVFESVAGAIFLDSNMSLDTVWRIYSNMMRPEIEQFSNSVPKSPIRELLEMEPETAKFSKPEKLADGRRVRVSVEVFGKGLFRGIGRNYRIAKCTAAKCALRHLKKQALTRKHAQQGQS